MSLLESKLPSFGLSPLRRHLENSDEIQSQNQLDILGIKFAFCQYVKAGMDARSPYKSSVTI